MAVNDQTNSSQKSPPRKSALGQIAHGLARVPLVQMAAGFAVLVAALSLPEPRTILSLEARTEIVSVKIANPNAAAFRLTNAQVEIGRPQPLCLASVLVRPQANAVVTYARDGIGEFFVTVQGEYDVDTPEGGLALTFDGPLRLFLAANAANCSSGPQELPANGILTVGAPAIEVTEANGQSLDLLSGKVSVFGRAVSSLFGAVPLSIRPFVPNALYFASDQPLIPGSMLFDAEDTNAPGPAFWRGTVRFATDDSVPGLYVSASANAAQVKLVAPTISGGGSSETDTVSLGLAARLAGDPNLRVLYWLLGLLGIGASIGDAMLRAFRGRTGGIL